MPTPGLSLVHLCMLQVQDQQPEVPKGTGRVTCPAHGKEKFNRAKLMNIGCTEALKEYDYSCFIFSDVDLIPIDDQNTYKCYSQLRHLSVFIDKFGFRIIFHGMNLSRPNKVIGRYHMIAHDKDKKNDRNPYRYSDPMINFTMDSDGLSSLNYKVIDVQKQPLYTKVIVDVGTPSL
ncbi:beta-1,4-galactosyltransferase 1-like [Polypterus senegalus]|uniref:beta-1,4-galactosyltransferase 1-like n=1 Tax=Polypterus senegalus TaxID=55291 RepID=UPI0019628B25|nr:beta-1,4-galactosyltransferase 1-like [Polypterus senegalus]